MKPTIDFTQRGSDPAYYAVISYRSSGRLYQLIVSRPGSWELRAPDKIVARGRIQYGELAWARAPGGGAVAKRSVDKASGILRQTRIWPYSAPGAAWGALEVES